MKLSYPMKRLISDFYLGYITPEQYENGIKYLIQHTAKQDEAR